MSGAGPGQREVAHRVFAAEFEDATYTYTESDEDRAPNYVVSPSGARINRLFLVGVLTETEWVNDETVRARVVDPTGAFVLYASQYQPDARAVLDEADTPSFLAVTGKANTFRPDGVDRVYSSVRPEAVAVVDDTTRDRWAVATAERTIGRLARLARSLEGESVDDNGVEIARREYDPTPGYVASLYERCIEVLRLVAGEIDAIDDRPLDLDQSGDPATSLADISAAGERVTSSEESSTPPDDEPTEAGSPTAADDESIEPVTGEDPVEDVLTDEERSEVEASFGTDFTTGDEIESEPEAAPEEIDESDEDPTLVEPDVQEIETDRDEGAATEADDADIDATEPTVESLVSLMRSMDDGSGVTHDRLVEAGAEAFGIDEDVVADLIQSALLEGQCYQAGDDVIRPI